MQIFGTRNLSNCILLAILLHAMRATKFWSVDILVCKLHMCKKIQDGKHIFLETSGIYLYTSVGFSLSLRLLRLVQAS